MSLYFTVEPGGDVTDASAEGRDLPSGVARCLVDLVESVHFSGYFGPTVNASYFVAF